MAKSILFLLALLAVVSARNSKIRGAAAAVDDDSDLQQRREAMAEVHRVFSNPVLAAAADSDTVHRAASFMKRELGPLGPIFRAISKMPGNSPADARSKEEAFDAAQELMNRHFRPLLVPHGSAEADDDDDDLAQRREAMAEVAAFGRPATRKAADAKTIHRLRLFIKREWGPLEDIFRAIGKMPENSPDEARTRDEAFDAAMELLDRKVRLLLPHSCPNNDDDAGFAFSKMPESTAAEVRSKEERRAWAKQLMSRHMRPAGSV